MLADVDKLTDKGEGPVSHKQWSAIWARHAAPQKSVPVSPYVRRKPGEATSAPGSAASDLLKFARLAVKLYPALAPNSAPAGLAACVARRSARC